MSKNQCFYFKRNSDFWSFEGVPLTIWPNGPKIDLFHRWIWHFWGPLHFRFLADAANRKLSLKFITHGEFHVLDFEFSSEKGLEAKSWSNQLFTIIPWREQQHGSPRSSSPMANSTLQHSSVLEPEFGSEEGHFVIIKPIVYNHSVTTAATSWR